MGLIAESDLRDCSTGFNGREFMPSPTRATLDLSVIIPVYNRATEIRRCVASVYAGTFDPTRYEVLVVDNGSTDETGRAAAGAGARVLSVAEANRCLARNEGARVARGRWLVFTDSDCEASPDWLARLNDEIEKIEAAAAAESPGADTDSIGAKSIGAIAGAIMPGDASSPVEQYIALRRWLDQEKFLTPGRRFSPPFAATANLAVRADVFSLVGGFDPEMPPAEDADWCWRASAAGFSIRYAPAATVRHHHRASPRAMIRQSYEYGLGNARLFAKHRAGFGARVWIEPRRYAWAAKGLLKSPWDFATGRTPLARRLAWYDFLANSAQAIGRLRGAAKFRMPIA